MKVSEAIDRLKVGDTVWVKGEINYINKAEMFPICCDLAETSIWICGVDEISLSEPNSISDEKVLELVSTNFRFDKENFWNQLKEIGMLPQAEKVVVPDYVAEWFKANKISLESNIAAAFRRIGSDKHYTKGSIYEWLSDSSNEPIQTLFKMKNGYTVKPKRWVVRTSSAYFEQFSGDSNHPFNFDATHNICVALTFNDRAKAEAVAVLVEGSVEEV